MTPTLLSRILVEQVYEILTAWIETRSWETAFLRVMPQRKFTQGPPAGKKQKVSHGESPEEGERKGEGEVGQEEAEGKEEGGEAGGEGLTEEELSLNQ